MCEKPRSNGIIEEICLKFAQNSKTSNFRARRRRRSGIMSIIERNAEDPWRPCGEGSPPPLLSPPRLRSPVISRPSKAGGASGAKEAIQWRAPLPRRIGACPPGFQSPTHRHAINANKTDFSRLFPATPPIGRPRYRRGVWTFRRTPLSRLYKKVLVLLPDSNPRPPRNNKKTKNWVFATGGSLPLPPGLRRAAPYFPYKGFSELLIY